MKKILITFLLFAFSAILPAEGARVRCGIDVLKAHNFDILKGKRVGLVTNPTGVDGEMNSTIDVLSNAKGVNLVALYSPEHGIRGDAEAGALVDSHKDKQTGLPVYSLYGKTRKPAPEFLKDIDVIVYDIQDNGSRSYTFISTMGLVMEAAAENGKEVVVLDRPNPLGGIKIEGNITEDGFISFVSQFKIPYVYGLTCGELAQMLNGEKMLEKGIQCKLTVVPMEGWTRNMTYDSTGLQWVPPSPHVPYKDTPTYYIATGVLGELFVISEGVGYTFPFQVFAAEWIDQKMMADRLNSYNIEGVRFRPLTFIPYYGKWAKKQLHGVQLHITDFNKVNLLSLQFYFMQACHELYPGKNIFEMAVTMKNGKRDEDRIDMFNKVIGSGNIKKMFSKSWKYSDIQGYLDKDINSFRELSIKYYLYQ